MDEKIKAELEAQFKPCYQKLVDEMTKFSVDLFVKVYCNLPETMTHEDKIKFIDSCLDSQVNSLVGSLKAFDVNQIVKDMEKLKENNNG